MWINVNVRQKEDLNDSKWPHVFLRPLRSCVHMFPERVPLLQRTLHPLPLVLWRRRWLCRRLWWAPLLQWVSHNSLTPKMGLLALCVCPPPSHYQLLGYCVSVSVGPICICVLWVMWRGVRVTGVFLCWRCGQSGLLLCVAFLCGDAHQCPLTNSTSPSLCPPGVTEPHFGFCLDSSPCMGMWGCHDYFESFASVVLCFLYQLKSSGGKYLR